MKVVNAAILLASAMCILMGTYSQASVRITGDSVGPTDNVYFPGYVDDAPTPLTRFVPQSLAAACDQLKAGDLTTARAAFLAYSRLHPGELAPYVGYLQAVRGQRQDLLPLYTKEAAENGTPVAEFRLGVLAFYLMGEQYQEWSGSGKVRKDALAKIARDSLEKAYHLSHAPVAGFVLVSCYGYTGGGPATRIYEDIMRHVGGEGVYLTYLQAKNHGWVWPQPAVPNVSHKNMLILFDAVWSLWAPNASKRSVGEKRTENGQVLVVQRPVPNTTEQDNASAYLGEWWRKIKETADAKGSVSDG